MFKKKKKSEPASIKGKWVKLEYKCKIYISYIQSASNKEMCYKFLWLGSSHGNPRKSNTCFSLSNFKLALPLIPCIQFIPLLSQYYTHIIHNKHAKHIISSSRSYPFFPRTMSRMKQSRAIKSESLWNRQYSQPVPNTKGKFKPRIGKQRGYSNYNQLEEDRFYARIIDWYLVVDLTRHFL